MAITHSRSPDSPESLSDSAANWRFLLRFDYVLEKVVELRETLMFSSLLKDIIKDTDGERYRVKSGRVLSPGASVPMELGCIILPVCGCVHQPGDSPNPMLLGCYRGFLT